MSVPGKPAPPHPDLMVDYKDKRIVVTGGSMGIGEAFARAYAARGAHLVLVARSEEKLSALAADLRSKHRVRADFVAVDLTRPEGPRELVGALALIGKVDILVNNAGFAAFGPFAAAGLDDQVGQVDLNVRALVELTHRLLPEIERQQGGVLNVASTAAFQPIANLAVYGATKAFVLSFSEALWAEYRSRGVRVLSVCPGATDTPFFARAGEAAAFGTKASPEDVVRVALRAYEQRRAYVVHGSGNYLTSLLPRFFSRELTALLTERLMRRPSPAAALRAPS